MVSDLEKLQRVLARLQEAEDSAKKRIPAGAPELPTDFFNSGVVYGLMTAIEILQKECK